MHMKELIKLASSIPRWALLPLGFVAAIALLFRRIITFEESIILILVAIVGDLCARAGALGQAVNGRKK